MCLILKYWKRVLRAFGKKRPKRYYLPAPYSHIYLTEREKMILLYLFKGASLLQIADTLGLNCRSVEFYLNNMQKKIAVDSLSEILRHTGIIECISRH